VALPMSSQPCTQPLALITGGGTGLGLATGLELRIRGFRVIAFGLDVEPELNGSGIEFQRVDITDETVMAKSIASVTRLDVLVNAAGVILQDGGEFTMDGFRKVVDINLHGTYLACELLRGPLAAARGNIINFASMWSIFGSARNPGYSASKGAVASLTRSLAVAYASEHIRVNAIAPGWIETRMSHAAFSDAERSAAIKKRLPLGHWGKPSDVAKVAAFLASADAHYVTGVTLPVDGGYSIA
jgi:NAD(P)-dependent dehydrogenase (short-subunit alcohol dehydrogenase family)